jgi:hypothetical protein
MHVVERAVGIENEGERFRGDSCDVNAPAFCARSGYLGKTLEGTSAACCMTRRRQRICAAFDPDQSRGTRALQVANRIHWIGFDADAAAFLVLVECRNRDANENRFRICKTLSN